MNTNNNNGINPNNAKKAANVYGSAVNTGCLVIDLKGDTIYSVPGRNGCSSCCRLSGNQGVSCSSAYLYGAYEAEKHGGRHIFFCPIGLVHWAAPILKDGLMVAAIIGGPVTLARANVFVPDISFMKNIQDNSTMEELRRFVNEIQFATLEKIASMSEILMYAAEHLSTAGTANRRRDDERHVMGGHPALDDTVSKSVEDLAGLVGSIAAKDKAYTLELLKKRQDGLFLQQSDKFETSKSRAIDFGLLLFRAALESKSDVEEIFGLDFRYFTRIEACRNVEELTSWAYDIIQRFIYCIFDFQAAKENDVIYKAVNYIGDNYMHKLTLKEVADHVFMSQSYFCRMFRDTTGHTFRSYTNNIRIEQSKALLRQTNMTLLEISGNVGFEEQGYFTKVFKKAVGLSPMAYRKQNTASRKQEAKTD